MRAHIRNLSTVSLDAEFWKTIRLRDRNSNIGSASVDNASAPSD